MNQEHTPEEILTLIKRFRILTVGAAGVGKSALINCVFRVGDAQVSDYKPGEADMDREITSPENPYFVGHDSKGFEPASLETFKVVRDFIDKRTYPDLELSERLHAVWLCIKTPTAGARVIEAGQENLLQLAIERRIPVVVVFTQYDRVVRLKTEQEANKILDECVASLESACKRLNIEMPPYINVSTRPKRDENIPKLANLTREVVQKTLPSDAGDAWIMWAIAQRRSIPLKIEASVSASMTYYARAIVAGNTPTIPGFGKPWLRKCLLDVHEGIIKCWNFRIDDSDEKILSSDDFRHMMVFIVEDIHQEPGTTSASGPDVGRINQYVTLASVASASIAPPVAIFGLTYAFFDWLTSAILENTPRVQRLFMAYTVDLILILQNLCEVTLTESHLGRPSWKAVEAAFDIYQGPQPLRPLRGVHDKIHSIVGNTFDSDSMRGSMMTLIDKYVPLDK